MHDAAQVVALHRVKTARAIAPQMRHLAEIRRYILAVQSPTQTTESAERFPLARESPHPLIRPAIRHEKLPACAVEIERHRSRQGTCREDFGNLPIRRDREQIRPAQHKDRTLFPRHHRPRLRHRHLPHRRARRGLNPPQQIMLAIRDDQIFPIHAELDSVAAHRVVAAGALVAGPQ